MIEKDKAKAYDEALKKASAAHKDEDRHLKATLERIFPRTQRVLLITYWLWMQLD